MVDLYKEKISKQAAEITDSTEAIRAIQTERFNESLLLLSQGWSGEAADKFMKKSQSIYENLTELLKSIDNAAEQLIDNDSKQETI